MNVNLSLSFVTLSSPQWRQIDAVREYRLLCTVPGEFSGRYNVRNVRRVSFTGNAEQMELVFGIPGPWEENVTSTPATGEACFSLRLAMPFLEPGPRFDIGAFTLADAETGPARGTPSLDRIVVEELLDQMRDHYPQPFGGPVAASVGGDGATLHLTVDMQRDEMRFFVNGREVRVAVSTVLGLLLDPDVARGVSIPAAPTPTGRRRRRAVVGRT
jgi:hypothetical protein